MAGNVVDILALERKSCFEDQEILEIGCAVGKGEFYPVAGDEFTLGIESGDALTKLPNLTTFPAGISVECSADGAGDADEIFETGEAELDGKRNQGRKLCAGTGDDCRFIPLFDLGEFISAEANDGSADAFVSDEEVRSSSENPGRNSVRTAAIKNGDKFLLRTGFDEVLRGSADLHPRMGSKGYVAGQDLRKFVKCCHAESG